MKSKRIRIEKQNGEKLTAIIDLPDNGEYHAIVITVHCFSCEKNYHIYRRLHHSLTDAGIAGCRFDLTGLGESEGSFSKTNFEENVSDTLAVVNTLCKDLTCPIFLMGHSLGGLIVQSAAQHLPAVKGIVTLATPSTLDGISSIVNTQLQGLSEDEEKTIQIQGRPFTVCGGFYQDLAHFDLNDSLRTLNVPHLILHPEKDAVVSLSHAYRLFEYHKENKELLVIRNANHLFSTQDAADRVGQILLSWFQNFLC